MAAIVQSKYWVDIPTNKSISQLTLLDNVSNTPGDKVVYEDTLTGRRCTYEGFRLQVKRTAYWLVNTMGLKPNQIVSIMAPSCVEYLLAIHACWWAGGIISTINSSLHVEELHHAVQEIEPDFIIFHDQCAEKVTQLLNREGHRFGLISLGAHSSSATPFRSRSDGGASELGLVALSEDSRNACAAIVLSSGTTGSPKAVMLSHYNLVSSCLQLRGDNEANWCGSQAEVFFSPLSHIYGIYVCATLSAWIGSYVCVMDRFDLKTYCKLLQDRKATLARLVPPIARLMALDPMTSQYRFPNLQYFSCSAAPLSDDVAAKLEARFPSVKVCQTYGCTELSGPIAQSGLRDIQAPLVTGGRLIANTQVRILDIDGKDIGPRGTGELYVRSPGLMMGYKSKSSVTTSDILPGNWYKTGDIGYVDDNGYVAITGRVKDVIKYKGFQVSPKELEDILLSHPHVLETAVCGVWDETQATELPTAFVVLHMNKRHLASERSTTRELVDFAASRVAGYKRLRGGIVFLEQLPISPTGKILKKNLRVPKDWEPETVIAKL